MKREKAERRDLKGVLESRRECAYGQAVADDTVTFTLLSP